MVIDSHCHILPPGFEQRRAELLARDATFATLFPKMSEAMATAESLVQSMEQSEICKAVVMGIGWTNIVLAREVNDYLIESVHLNPQRLHGFCSVNPASHIVVSNNICS